MPVSYGNIAGQEPSTITFRVATVAITRGSTSEQQEILTIGDPQTSNALARVVATPPVSTEFGMVVRIAGGPSSAVDLAMRPVFSSTSADNPVSAAQAGSWTVRSNLSSTAVDNPVSAAQAGTWNIGTVTTVSSLAGIVTVRPSDTNWASSAGFHFNSSGELLAVVSPGNSTVVSVAAKRATYNTKGTITITSTGLTSGSARESNYIDNTASTAQCVDYGIFIKRTGTAGSTAFVDYYIYASNGDTTFTDGATGSDASFTAANRRQSRYLGSLQMQTTSNASGYFRLSDVFAVAPSRWGLIEINNSAGTLGSTGSDFVTTYEGYY